MSKITIETTIAADINTVWKNWTDPAHIVNWNFAIDTWHCPKASNDLRVGGKFSSTMAAKDGSFSFDFAGTYDEVIDQKKIAYTMEDGRQCITTFETVGNGVKITSAFDPETINPVDMQRDGWLAILTNFKKYTEAH